MLTHEKKMVLLGASPRLDEDVRVCVCCLAQLRNSQAADQTGWHTQRQTDKAASFLLHFRYLSFFPSFVVL